MNSWSKITVFLIIILLPIISYAQKTDTVYFYNGDRAICEVKGLIQGKLTIKTVAMGTISVEWRNVSNIISNKYYEIVFSDHSTLYGRIEGVDSLRNVTISFGIFEESAPIQDIVKFIPLSSNFWKDLEGKLNAGFSFTKGTQNLQTSASGEVKYRTDRTSHLLYFSNNISVNEANESEKQDGGYRFQLFYKKQIFNALDLRWERNTELGIASRLITMLSAGYSPVENNFNVLSVELGGSINRELSIEQEATNNAELMLRFTYDLFVFAKPKIFVTFKSETYPSFTVKDRIRSNIDTSISWEVFKDFTFGVAYWGNYDNKPVNTTGLTFDWGVNTTIGYNF